MGRFRPKLGRIRRGTSKRLTSSGPRCWLISQGPKSPSCRGWPGTSAIRVDFRQTWTRHGQHWGSFRRTRPNLAGNRQLWGALGQEHHATTCGPNSTDCGPLSATFQTWLGMDKIGVGFPQNGVDVGQVRDNFADRLRLRNDKCPGALLDQCGALTPKCILTLYAVVRRSI